MNSREPSRKKRSQTPRLTLYGHVYQSAPTKIYGVISFDTKINNRIQNLFIAANCFVFRKWVSVLIIDFLWDITRSDG